MNDNLGNKYSNIYFAKLSIVVYNALFWNC